MANHSRGVRAPTPTRQPSQGSASNGAGSIRVTSIWRNGAGISTNISDLSLGVAARGRGTGADIGCGSGRWAVLVAPRVDRLHLVDASADALAVARTNLADLANVDFHLASVDALPFAENSLDFAFSLGVLHHVPDTAAALRSVAGKLKPGAPFLIYLYYAFDNRPAWYRFSWRVADVCRLVISALPNRAKYAVSQAIAAAVYWPLARSAALLDRRGILPAPWLLSYYRDASFYVMRNDALDRFGTKLERRFTRDGIRLMMERAGLSNIRFSESMPYWCAVGIKRPGEGETSGR